MEDITERFKVRDGVDQQVDAESKLKLMLKQPKQLTSGRHPRKPFQEVEKKGRAIAKKKGTRYTGSDTI